MPAFVFMSVRIKFLMYPCLFGCFSICSIKLYSVGQKSIVKRFIFSRYLLFAFFCASVCICCCPLCVNYISLSGYIL